MTALVDATYQDLVRLWCSLLTAPDARTTRVYAIGVDRGAVKIGTAVDPAQRLAVLQTASPDELELLGSVPGSVALERRIHRALAEDHLTGEWFVWTENVEALLDALHAVEGNQ